MADAAVHTPVGVVRFDGDDGPGTRHHHREGLT